MSENDAPDNGLDIPEEWEDARPFIRTMYRRVDERFDAIEDHLDRADEERAAQTKDISVVERRIDVISGDLTGVRSGISVLNERVSNLTDSYGILINLQNSQGIEERERGERIEQEQKVQTDLLRAQNETLQTIHKHREDKHRTFWRTIMLLSMWAVFFAMIIKPYPVF